MNLRVVLGQLLLLLREVVESALVALSVAMFLTENVTTLASVVKYSYFLATVPALVEVGLNIIWLGLTDRQKLFVNSEQLATSSLTDITATPRQI